MAHSNNDPNGDTFGEFLSAPMAPKPTLNLDPDTAFLRGIEYASHETVEGLIEAIRAMKKPNTYSNQDIDKRMTVRSEISFLRLIGNTPISR